MTERESILIYKSYYEAGKKSLSDEQFGKYFKIILDYGFYGEEIKDTGDPLIDAMMILIKPLLDANKRNYENSKKGGAPKGNQNARKKSTQNNQKQPPVDSTENNQNNQKQPNVNVNANVNVNVKDNMLNDNENIYPSFSDESLHKIGKVYDENGNEVEW